MKKYYGFTLAEVLITLGVIGTVAAMTIPVIFSNVSGAQYRSKFKKAVSTLNQAGLMAQSQYDFNFAGTSTTCSSNRETAATEHPDTVMSFCAILNGTLSSVAYYGQLTNLKRYTSDQQIVPYKLETKETIPDDYESFLTYTLADGMIVAFHPDAVHCELPLGSRITQDFIEGGGGGLDLSNCVGFVDVNGVSLPNREVNCSEGTNRIGGDDPCVVKNNAGHMTDVFPIVFHDTTVEPASAAAAYVLDTSKL